MRLVVLALTTGCMTGIGPTLAIRPDNGHATIGLEGSEDFSGLGFNQGVVFDDDRILPYLDIHAYKATNGMAIGDNGLQDNAGSYAGASLGVTKVPTGGEAMFGAYVMGARASHVDCDTGDTVLTITAGIRYRGGLEIFVTPKAYYRDARFCLPED